MTQFEKITKILKHSSLEYHIKDGITSSEKIVIVTSFFTGTIILKFVNDKLVDNY